MMIERNMICGDQKGIYPPHGGRLAHRLDKDIVNTQSVGSPHDKLMESP